MHKEIKKAGRDVIAAALKSKKSKDYTELKRIRQIAESNALEVFNAVAYGASRVAWYDKPPVTTQSGAVSVMRCALHRSTKKDGYLQLSYMEVKDGCTIPTGDLQFSIADGFREFSKELPCNVIINF